MTRNQRITAALLVVAVYAAVGSIFALMRAVVL